MNGFPDTEYRSITDANQRFDHETHSVTMDAWLRFKTRWPTTASVGKPLTDRKISEYQRRGFYSQEYRDARREHWRRKEGKHATRSGNFLIHSDGTLVFCPV